MIENSEHKLHYDLDFLNIEGVWMPKEDAKRLEAYRFAQEQFELTPEDMLYKLFPSGMLDLRSYGDFVHSTRLLGYPRLLTLKTVDMILGQPPLISAQAQDKATEKIKDLRAFSQFNAILKQALTDYSRFGVCLLRIYLNEKGVAKLAAWNPNEWVPVFYDDGTNRIHYNVIGWRSGKKLTLQIHNTEDGSYEHRECVIDDYNVINEIKSSKKYNTSSGKQLLYAIVNTPTTTNPLGTGDYEIINGLLQKAIQRLQAILRVLDEHADPSMTGAHTLLSRSDNGELVFKTSKFYAVGNDEQKPEYIVWNANLESSFKAFDELCKQIFVLSEMGEAFLGLPGAGGNVVSGTAMRYKMLSPLEKARRITNEITEPIKNVISTMLSLSGEKIEAKDINVAWRDSLPKDPREVAELAKLESGSLSIKPLLHAIMDNFDLDQESAQKYVEQIITDQEVFAGFNKKAVVDNVDGRSDTARALIDSRIKGSQSDPASSENKGDDERAKLK